MNDFFIILLLLLTFSVKKSYSQKYVGDDKFKAGLKAGISLNTFKGNAFTTSYFTRGFSLGLYYRQKFKNGIHFQTEITPAIRGAKFTNSSDTGYEKINLLYIDFTQLLIKDLNKNNNTHCLLAGIQPSVLLQSWVYNNYYKLSPAARDIALNSIDFSIVAGYQLNKKTFGIQSLIKIGLLNINRGLNMRDHDGRRLGPTNDKGTIRNLSLETSITF
ncbi:MAG: outer membrane beta-barrel protein [Bacteroidetes bacterium]|nr:outer membrane beta-barrel protein [Bacteroidota bacterium]